VDHVGNADEDRGGQHEQQDGLDVTHAALASLLIAMNGTLATPLDADDHVRGPAGADLELVMYGDFQCPFCLGAQSVLRRVADRLAGRLRFAFRHFPLDVHPQARLAAELSEAAGARGGFWAVHDALYGGQGRVDDDRGLLDVVRAAGYDADSLQAEVAAGRWSARVERDLRSGRASGVAGTPAFFVGGVVHDGAYDAASLVDALLASA
jgi:protein-disulfide isomerase